MRPFAAAAIVLSLVSAVARADEVCDDADHKSPPGKSCWGAIREFHKKDLALLPLTRKAKPEPVPETKVIVNDRQPKK